MPDHRAHWLWAAHPLLPLLGCPKHKDAHGRNGRHATHAQLHPTHTSGRNEEAAAAKKDEGNLYYSEKNYAQAVKEFSDWFPFNHALWSNRSACYAEGHVLINNAALFIFESVETATAEDWDRACSVNIKGHALVTKHVLPLMKKAGGGSIVFQGSISSFVAQPNCATYSTMKGAIVQLARSEASTPGTGFKFTIVACCVFGRNCAYDFSKYNIRVNSVCAVQCACSSKHAPARQHACIPA